MRCRCLVVAAMGAVAVAGCSFSAQAQFVCSGGPTGMETTSGGSTAAVAGGGSACGTSNGAIGMDSVAFGAGNSALGSFSAALGVGAAALGNSSIAIGAARETGGTTTLATGSTSVAVGYYSEARSDGGVALGAVARVLNGAVDGIAIGAQAQVGPAGTNALAIGRGANANFAGSSAIGNGAATTRANQVAVGTAGNTYTMSGVTSAASRASQAGPTQLVTSDAGGNLATASLADLGLASNADVATLGGQLGGINAQLGAINSRLSAVEQRLDQQMNEYRNGIALALASSRLSFDTRPGKVSVSAGVGHFKGQSATAIGLGYALSTDTRVNAAFTAAGSGDIAVSAGASWTLN